MENIEVKQEEFNPNRWQIWQINTPLQQQLIYSGMADHLHVPESVLVTHALRSWFDAHLGLWFMSNKGKERLSQWLMKEYVGYGKDRPWRTVGFSW